MRSCYDCIWLRLDMDAGSSACNRPWDPSSLSKAPMLLHLFSYSRPPFKVRMYIYTHQECGYVATVGRWQRCVLDVLLSEFKISLPAWGIFEMLGVVGWWGLRPTSSRDSVSYRHDILTVDFTLVSYSLIEYLAKCATDGVSLVNRQTLPERNRRPTACSFVIISLRLIIKRYGAGNGNCLSATGFRGGKVISSTRLNEIG